ncbi:MAG: TPM domain-containing protein [Kocuria sp.]|nr:TPM domain-containing protein [Kocuria sp.]
MTRSRALIGAVSLFLATFCLSACGGDRTAIPDPPAHGNVLDQAEVLSDDDERALNQRIDERNAHTDGARVAILTIDGVDGDWEDWTRDAAEQWGIGDKDKDNGILIAVDTDDRVTRIEVADGARETFTDDDASTVTEDVQGISSPGKEQGFWEKNAIYLALGTILLLLLIVALLYRYSKRRMYRKADREISEYLRENPGAEVDPETRKAFRTYRFNHPRRPGDEDERERRREEARKNGEELDPKDDPQVFTQYASSFGAWLPLYAASPTLYSGPGTHPSSGSVSSGTSFGGGAGFSGGGATGSF